MIIMKQIIPTVDTKSAEKYLGLVAHPCKLCGILTLEFRIFHFAKEAITFRYFTCDVCDKGIIL